MKGKKEILDQICMVLKQELASTDADISEALDPSVNEEDTVLYHDYLSLQLSRDKSEEEALKITNSFFGTFKNL